MDASDPLSAIGELPKRARNWQGRIIRENGTSEWINLRPNIHSLVKTDEKNADKTSAFSLSLVVIELLPSLSVVFRLLTDSLVLVLELYPILLLATRLKQSVQIQKED